MTLQKFILFLLVEGLVSRLVAADWPRLWLLKVGVGCGNILNKTTVKFAT
jgi:hypothetical protein